jgi:hypothetical protein
VFNLGRGGAILPSRAIFSTRWSEQPPTRNNLQGSMLTLFCGGSKLGLLTVG